MVKLHHARTIHWLATAWIRWVAKNATNQHVLRAGTDVVRHVRAHLVTAARPWDCLGVVFLSASSARRATFAPAVIHSSSALPTKYLEERVLGCP